ncbi:hypothetical protein O6H91_13G055400 [Diphasiastrum complanatum]|uniref:Uncharacterized protein n=1 Tax=Diphasiastrum complanatum TaxID=34168 RepID=A0ACC2BUX2_DIPCM|nr:hypothetical protein O6H91_13G055400 [Diphasiastrum complanatum]
MDGQGLGKKSLSASRTWMVIDTNGRTKILEVEKHAIMHRVGIHARDLRILDPLLSYPSTILGRERAIVLNLEHIKAIITAEEVLLRNPADTNLVPIIEELSRGLPIHTIAHDTDGSGVEANMESNDVQNQLSIGQEVEADENTSPFEFRALEIALESICSFLDARATELEAAAYPALDELTSKISSRNLDRVRKLKSGMTRLTARVQKVRDELEQLLDDDEDMAELYLTRKLAMPASPDSESEFPASPTIGSRITAASRGRTVTTNTHGSEDDIEELEMLLEAYFMQIDGTLNKLNTLREYIDDTEDYINIQLDNHRNQLIQLELILSSATVVMAIFSLVAGIFGMNIPYPWNTNHGYMFKWVVLLTGLVCFAMFSALLFYARYRGLIGT